MSDSRRTSDPAPTDRPRSIWRSIPRGLWIGVGVAAVLVAAGMWWGGTFEAAERARIAAEGGATMQGGLAIAFLAVLVPIVIGIFAGAATGGRLAILAAETRPTARFGTRFGVAVLPALAVSIGSMLVAALVAALACVITVQVTGYGIDAMAPLMIGVLVAAISAATALVCVTIASSVASVMLRRA